MTFRRALAAPLPAAIVVIVVSATSSCALVRKAHPRPGAGPDFSFRVIAEPGANMDSPIAVDLVMVRDKKLVSRLAGLSAAAWFAERDQFLRDLLGSPKMDFRSWEWAPGQTDRVHVQYPAKGWAAILFARYRTPGVHRVRTDPFRSFTLRLGQETLSVEEAK